MGKILIKGGRVWDGEKFFFADVMTENQTVARIEAGIEDEADFVFDAEGKTVSAGLVDIHTHFKGISSNGFGINPDMVTLPFGVTAAADASGIQGDRALLDAFGVKNAVFVCSDIKNNKASFDGALCMMEKYGDKVVGIKAYFDVTSNQVFDISPLRETVEFAEKHGLKVMVHSSNSPVPMSELLGALRCGDILTHAYHGAKNNVSEDGFACIGAARERGVVIDAGLAGFVHTDFKVLGDAIAIGEKPDVISSDITKCSAYKRGGRYGLTMCMSIARHLGMTEAEVLRAVTSSAARAVSKEGEWGTLSVGGTADIAVLEYTDEGFDMTDKAGNHIESKEGYRNILTVSDGEIVYRR